jgi:lysine-N-methylase
MSRSLSVNLPAFQHYDCQNCTYCCRKLLVLITRAERDRILEAGWADRLPGQRLFYRYKRFARRPFMLAHRPDGACVFLGDNKLCRLHAETGIKTKPLPCRLYPFVPTPAIDGVRMDLRCDCLSVAYNKGRSLSVHARDIAQMVAELRMGPQLAAPAWRGWLRLSGREFAAVVEAFVRLVRPGSLDHRSRLRAGCLLLETLYELRPRKVRGERFAELMTLLADGAAMEAAQQTKPDRPLPRRVERLFGQWLFLHALAEDPQLARAGPITKLARSWRRYGQSRVFARGRGLVPRVQDQWPMATFEQLLAVRPAPDEALEPVCRFIQLKLDAHAFAGPAYYDHNVIRGLTALWLFPSIAGWLARLRAAGAGRDAMNAEDVTEGVRAAAATFGLSPVFDRLSERLRLGTLAQAGVPTGLLRRYGA